MAVSVDITTTMTTMWNADTAGTWTGSSPDTFSGFQREGTACLGIAVSNETVNTYTTVTSFNATQRIIYIWVSPRGTMDTTANGGIRIVAGDGTNTVAYYVGGSDYATPFTTGGGWYCYVLDANNLPTNFATINGNEALIDWTAITQVGVGFKTLSKSLGGAANCFWDIGRHGTGLIIGGGTSGDPGKWSEIAADDESTASGKAYGIIMEFQPGVYGVQGQITFGDNGTGSSHFEDTDAIIVFMDTGVANNFYKIDLIGNSTGTNVFIQGIKTGSGDEIAGSNGITIMSGDPSVNVDLDNVNMDTVHWYAGKFFKIYGNINLPTDTTSEIAGVIFDQCIQVTPNKCFLRNCIFSNTYSDSALVWDGSINIKNSTFSSNSDTIDASKHGIEHPIAGEYDYDNLIFSGNDYDIEFSAASGDLTINAVNGANPATYNITGGGTSVTIVSPVSLTLTNLPNNTLVSVVKTSDRSVLHQENTGETGTEVVYNYGASEIGLDVDILFMNINYDPNIGDILDFTLPGENTTLPISLIIDRTYIE